MKVIATDKGYHGSLREIGDEFEVPDGAKAKWFVPANPVKSTGSTDKPEEGKDKGAKTGAKTATTAKAPATGSTDKPEEGKDKGAKTGAKTATTAKAPATGSTDKPEEGKAAE